MSICAYKGLLRRDNPYRFKKKAFDGTVEEEVARTPLTGTEVYIQVKGIETIFHKPASDIDRTTWLWKKETIFLEILILERFIGQTLFGCHAHREKCL